MKKTALSFLLSLAIPAAAIAQVPALPPGLAAPAEKPEKKENAPALPPGLAAPDTAPALPPGLDNGSQTAAEPKPETGRSFPSVHGFWELRGGVRTQHDYAVPRDASIGESRLQLQFDRGLGDRAAFEFTGDFLADGVLEEGDFDLRQARLTATLGDSFDLRIGRQVLTWGTGDMLFINDLFPKDWQSFFIGRDTEYLKAPSDALKLGYFGNAFNLEVVYTPQFNPDRYIRGERISFWNPLLGRHAGRDNQVNANLPNDWFEEDEWALRLYRNAGKFELAAYAYAGYWKSPGGQRMFPVQATFPKLNVYGASARGPIGRGIANLEVGYYDSRQDASGDKTLVNNAEFRLLAGYERELGRNFTGAMQYYLEHMMDYSAYEHSQPFFMPKRDQDRHVFTMRLTKLLLDQNLRLSLFTYYSPSDQDAYLRPNANYKINDHWTIESGANIFLGESDTTFFGQFEHNSNVYFGARWAF